MSARKELFKIICDKYEVSETELLTKKRKGALGEARQAAILIAYMEITKNKTLIALWFGRKKCHTISEILDNAYGRYEHDTAFKKQINKIIEQL